MDQVQPRCSEGDCIRCRQKKRQCTRVKSGCGYCLNDKRKFRYKFYRMSGQSRNLPSNARLKLFTWLNEHLRHPYPTKAEKQELAASAEISISQVDTWFANARSRKLTSDSKGSPAQTLNSSPGGDSATPPEAIILPACDDGQNPLQRYLSSSSEDEAAPLEAIQQAAQSSRLPVFPATRLRFETTLDSSLSLRDAFIGALPNSGSRQINASRAVKASHLAITIPDRLVAPIEATVSTYYFANPPEPPAYWYIVNALMEDGNRWELHRRYQDFYELQIDLLTEFQEEGGSTPGRPRTLPFMPGPVTEVTAVIASGRRQPLDEYVKALCAMPPNISRCHTVRRMFKPREGAGGKDKLFDDSVLETRSMSGCSSGSSAASWSDSVSQAAWGKKRGRKRHLSGELASDSVPPIPPIPSGYSAPNLGRFQCTFCVAQFNRKYDWKRHEESRHIPQSHWTCTLTGPAIERYGRFICVYCGTTIRANSSHFSKVHSVEACLQQPESSRSFIRKDHLLQHLRIVHDARMTVDMTEWQVPCPDEQYSWLCGFCAVRPTSWQGRLKHISAHYLNGKNMSEWNPDISPYPIDKETGIAVPGFPKPAWNAQALAALKRNPLSNAFQPSDS